MNADKRTRSKEPALPPIEQLLLSGSQGSRADSSLESSEDSMFRMSDSLLGVFSDLEPSLVEPPCSRKEKAEKQLRNMAKTNPKAYDSIMKNQQKVLDSKLDHIITKQGSNSNLPQEREAAGKARKKVDDAEGDRDPSNNSHSSGANYESFRDLLNGNKEGSKQKAEPELQVEPKKPREPEKVTVVDYLSTGQVEAFTPLLKKPPLPPKSPRAKAEAPLSAQGPPLQKKLSQVSAASGKSAKSTKSNSSRASKKSFLSRVSKKSQKPEPEPIAKSESIKPTVSAVSKKSHEEKNLDPQSAPESKLQTEFESDSKPEQSPQTGIKSSVSSEKPVCIKSTESVNSAGSRKSSGSKKSGASSKKAPKPASPVERNRSTSSHSIDFSTRTPSVYLPPHFQRLQEQSKEGTPKSEASPATNTVSGSAPKNEETGNKDATECAKKQDTRVNLLEGTPKSEFDALSGHASSFFSGLSDVQTGAAVVKPVTKPEPTEMIPTSADKVKSILEALSDSAWVGEESPKQAAADVVETSSSKVSTTGSIAKAGTAKRTLSKAESGITEEESAILRKKDEESTLVESPIEMEKTKSIDEIQFTASAASAPADFPSVQKSSSADASTTPVLAGAASPFDEAATDKDGGKPNNTDTDMDMMQQKVQLVSAKPALNPSKWKSKFNVKSVFHRGVKTNKLLEIPEQVADDLDEEIHLLEDELEVAEPPASAKEKKNGTKRHKSPLRGIFHRSKPTTTEDMMAAEDELSPEEELSRSPSPDRVSVAMSEVSVPLTSIEKKAEHFFGKKARPADESTNEDNVADSSKKVRPPIIKVDYKNTKEIEIVSKSASSTPMPSPHSFSIENTSTPKKPEKVGKGKISRIMKKFIHNRRPPTKKEELTPVFNDACVEDKLSLLPQKEKKDDTAVVQNEAALDNEQEVSVDEVSKDETELETTYDEETLVTDIVENNKADTKRSHSWFAKVGDMMMSTGCSQIRCGETDCLTEEAQKAMEEKWDPIVTDFESVSKQFESASKQVTNWLTPRAKACAEEAEMILEEEAGKGGEGVQALVSESIEQSCDSMTDEGELSNDITTDEGELSNDTDMFETRQTDEPQADESKAEAPPPSQTEVADTTVASLEKKSSAEPKKKGDLKVTERFKKTLRGRFAKKKALLVTEEDKQEPVSTPSPTTGATTESPSGKEDQVEAVKKDPTSGSPSAPAMDASPKNDDEVAKPSAPESDNAEDEGNESGVASSETETEPKPEPSTPVSFQSEKTPKTKNKFFPGKVAKWKVAKLLMAQKKHNAAIIAKAAANGTPAEVSKTGSNAEYLTVLAVSDESLDEKQQSAGSASSGPTAHDVVAGPQLTPIVEQTDTEGGQSKSAEAEGAAAQEQFFRGSTSSDTAEQVQTSPTGGTEETGIESTISSFESPRRHQHKPKVATAPVAKHRSEQTEQTGESRQIDSVSFDNATFDDDLSNAFMPRLPGMTGNTKWLW